MQTKFSKSLLLASTTFSFLFTQPVNAALYPLSFNEMYRYASAGNLTVLNNAILRGLDINSTNSNGDTGICAAIRRNDHVAYETFKRAGANTRPRCLNKLTSQQQKRFADAHKPYEVIYEDDDNSLWWWVGGAAVVGGVAIAAGGGGGGGSSSAATTPEDPTVHSDKGLGYIVGTVSPSEPETSPYQAVSVLADNNITLVNQEALQINNNSNMWVYDAETGSYNTIPLANLINFDSDINSYTKYLAVGMQAHDKSVVINDSEQTITLSSNTIGMDATLNSSASNLGTIEISAQNGGIGMIASDYSDLTNNGTISIEYTGQNITDSTIGMYVDTNSSAENKGTISAKADTAYGKITGMQTRLTNYYSDFSNQAVNNGNIEITGSANDAGALSLWGMSSWMDASLSDGTQSTENLDKANITNNGNINLTYTLQTSEEEGSTPSSTTPLTLADGNGGIVGMHADANTTATNNGNISIILSGDSGQTLGAGMMSVRGGNLSNTANHQISVTSEGTSYGMIATPTTGGNQDLDNAKSSITNAGNITVSSKDAAYGIYSTAYGDVNHSGSISIADSGISYGIYKENGNINNSGGTISITGTGAKNSYAITAHASASDNYKINNASTITMTFSSDGQEEEEGDDGGLINSVQNYGIYASGIEIINSGNITISQQNNTNGEIYGISSQNGNIQNSGVISLTGNGNGITATNANINNTGSIFITGNGFALTTINGNITNSGNLNYTGKGSVVYSTNGNVINNGEIFLEGNGSAIYVHNGNITNNANGKITIVSNNSASMSGLNLVGKNHTLQNEASIYITSAEDSITQKAYGIFGDNNLVTNNGSINIGTTESLFSNATGIYSLGTINNSGNINIYGSGYGISGNGLTNKGNITIYQANGNGTSYGIYGASATTTNYGRIYIYSSDTINNTSTVFGLYGRNTQLINNGDITIGNNNNMFNLATGIYIQGQNLQNYGSINIYGSGQAINAVNADITNNSNGNITMIVNGDKDSYGIYQIGNSDNVVNNSASIKINASNDYQTGSNVALIYSKGSTISNQGNLELGAQDATIDNGIGISAENGNINNEGSVTLYGQNSVVLKSTNGDITNNGAATLYGNGTALYTDGNVTNNNKGNLTVYTDGQNSSYGIYATTDSEASITNLAAIYIGQGSNYSQNPETANYGIWTDNSSIFNYGSISLGSSNAILDNVYGLYISGNGNIENSGVINMYGGGIGIYTETGTINNLSTSGIINIFTNGNTNSYGITTSTENNNLINNQNKITILASSASASSKENIGILANNISNSGTIEIGNNNTPINNAIGLKGQKIVNSGAINMSGEDVNAIVSEQNDTNINNKGNIKIQNCINGSCNGIWAKTSDYLNLITNSGSIEINASGTSNGILNASGTVENSGNITIYATTSYGIYAQHITNSGSVTMQHSSSYALGTANGSIINNGTITINSFSSYGLYGLNNSYLYNTAPINILADNGYAMYATDNISTYNSGTLNINGQDSYGLSITGGTITNEGNITTNDTNNYAIYANGLTSLKNSGNITINGNQNYGIYATGVAEINNTAPINVNGENSVGFYVDNSQNVSNSAMITVTGNNSIGVYAAGNSSVLNQGQIRVDGQGSYGIYATGTSSVNNTADIYLTMTSADNTTSALYANGKATVTNSGNLYIVGSNNSNIYAAMTSDSGIITNYGTIYVSHLTDTVMSGNVDNQGTIEVINGNLSLNSGITFDTNSKFIANKISGIATVSSNAVKQSNQTTYVLENNFEGNTDNLEVASQSFLFNSDFDGKQTTLTMKKFEEVEENASLSEFLQDNYAANNNQELFDELKSASTQSELSSTLTRQTGRDFIPALAEQNLALMKDLNRQISNSWFAAAPNEKIIAAVNYYNREFKAHDYLSGSNVNAVSLYGLLRNTDAQTFSYGLGWNFTKMNAKFDNDVSKDEVIAQILLPYGIHQNYFDFFGNLYGGYGYGDYTRYADGKRYKGDIKNYYYGINNELRANITTIADISIQPTAELNVNALYQRGINDGQLDIQHNNNVSVESGLGLYAEKKFELDENNIIRLRAGGTWYHEYNDNYQNVKVGINGMDGTFALGKLSTDQDRALLSINGEYKNGNFSLYGESALDVGSEENWIFNLGIKYAF